MMLKITLVIATISAVSYCNVIIPPPPSTSGGDGGKSESGDSKKITTIRTIETIKPKSCEDGMKMVQDYLETSKIELIDNIKAAKEARCKSQAWRKVDSSMVSHSHHTGVAIQLLTNTDGGLSIIGQVSERGCVNNKYSYSLVHIKGKWQRIMYTQVFKGSASCWRIFGQEVPDSESNLKAGLERFNPTMGDIIFNQKRMGSSTVDEFGGSTGHCDNDKDNFWHAVNGVEERRATVMLRRKKGAKDSGIYTWTSCGTPQYEIKDIYVLM